MEKGKSLKIVWVVVEILILVYALQALLPIVFGVNTFMNSNLTQYPNSFYNSSVWGTFGAAILPIVYPLLISAAVLFIVIMAVLLMVKKKGGDSGKNSYGM